MQYNLDLVRKKQARGIPLEPEEQALLAQAEQNMNGVPRAPGPPPGAPAPVAAPQGGPPITPQMARMGQGQPYVPQGGMVDPMIAMAQRYRDEANAPAETQFDPRDLQTILGADAVPAEMEANDRQMARAQKLREAQMAQPGRISMSSGTSYTPANTSGEMWANLAQQAVGGYQMRKAEQWDRELRRQKAEGEGLYKSRAYDPKTQMELDAARGLRDIKPPQVDLGKDTMADKLRKFRSRYMNI